MKKFSIMGGIILLLALFVSCNSDELNSLIHNSEESSDKIAAIDQQVVKINESLAQLQKADKDLGELIASLKEEDSSIKKSLESTKKALEDKIAELKAYVDEELKKSKNWVSATFATLEQYQSLCDEVATLKENLSALDSSLTSKIDSSISSLESSMMTWVNSQLANYYTIAEMNAKLEALQKSVTDGDTANAEEIEKLAQTLKTEVENLTAAYKKAITEAITENNGIIDGKIQKEIADVNTRIDNEVKTLGDKIAAIEKRIKEIEGRIKTIDEQIASINATLKKLKDLEDAISALETEDDTIKGLIEDAKKALEDKIAELKAYVDDELKKNKNWASATFATLTQYQSLCDEVAALKQRLDGIEYDLSGPLSDLEESMKTWVNGQLANYYTIAEINAKLEALQDAITNGDSANAEEIATLKQNLETAKSELTTAYQTAIEEAIKQNNGVINQKIADDIKAATDALQEKLDGLSARIDAIENRVAALEDKVAKIISGVQSVVVVPDYSDGSVKLSNIADNKIRFEVYPLEAAAAIAETGPSILSLDYVETITKSTENFVNLPVTDVVFTGKTLTLTVDATSLPETIISGSASANARLRISDGTNTRSSEYFPISAGLALPTTLQAVDLGLSVKWANMNVGASAPEEYGDYFAWGETEPDPDFNYSFSTYKHKKSGSGFGDVQLSKYCTDSARGTVDNLTVLEPEDDVASVVLGSSWRIPTCEEWLELKQNCEIQQTTINGIEGFQVISKINGNSIFLPAMGHYNGTDWIKDGHTYWSSELSGNENRHALQFSFAGCAPLDRCKGAPVRAVSFTAQDISASVITLEASDITTFTATLNGQLYSDSELSKSVWFLYSESANTLDGLKTNGSKISSSLTDNGLFTSTLSSLHSNTKYYYIAVSRISNKEFYGEVKSFTTTENPTSEPEAVDLGLSIKWANMNVGASNPEGYGDYFAWGELEPKDYYDWSTYKWSVGNSYSTFTKYCDNPDQGYEGFTDNKTTLDLEDDAAHVIWGNNWRMPTNEEWTELREQCTWEWTTQNGINGRLVTGPNGNSIFLPAAGRHDHTGLGNAGDGGFYWSSTLWPDGSPDNALNETFDSESIDMQWLNRARVFGRSIRPVYGDGSLNNPFNVAAARAAVKDLTWTSNTEYQKVGPFYVRGKISKIADKGTYGESGEYGNAMFYISDNGAQGTEFFCFRVLYLGNQKYTSGTDIKVGDEVIIHAELMNYRGNTPETVSNSGYLYILNGDTGGEPGPEPGGIIVFADENVKKKLVRKFDTDGDGELSYAEAASVTSGDDLKAAFGAVKTYQSFDEFQYFTGITAIPDNMFAGWELTSIKLPENITSLGERMFEGCTKLTTITLPSKLESIRGRAFYGWTGLKSIIIPSNIKSIGSDAFRGCTALSSITIPNNVTSLDWSVFEDCTGLTSVIIEGGITAINGWTFSNCCNLSSITLPDSITSIGICGFENCFNLTNIDIPKNVSLIDDRAFANSGLTSLTIPKNVTSIGGDAFCDCSNLTKITILPTNPPSGANGMFSNTNNCPIYVPAESLEDYQDGFYWIDYADRYQPIPE